MNENDLRTRVSRVLEAGPAPERKAEDVLGPTGIAGIIDHTLLNPAATPADIDRLCDEALAHGFFSVCVNPVHVPTAHKRLAGSLVRVGTVAGFPLGAATSSTKAFEAGEAVQAGAAEIDMVMNVGALKAGDYALVTGDIAGVVAACRPGLVKVIIETALLERGERVAACVLAKDAGAAFVKTSTGFAQGGATLEDIALMRASVGPEMGVKAAGGIRSLSMSLAAVRAGANRIGTSSGTAIVRER